MAFDLVTVSTHAGSGMLGTLLTFFGFKSRLDAVDRKIADLEGKLVFKDVHVECSHSWQTMLGQLNQNIADLNKKMDALLMRNNKP